MTCDTKQYIRGRRCPFKDIFSWFSFSVLPKNNISCSSQNIETKTLPTDICGSGHSARHSRLLFTQLTWSRMQWWISKNALNNRHVAFLVSWKQAWHPLQTGFSWTNVRANWEIYCLLISFLNHFVNFFLMFSRTIAELWHSDRPASSLPVRRGDLQIQQTFRCSSIPTTYQAKILMNARNSFYFY